MKKNRSRIINLTLVLIVFLVVLIIKNNLNLLLPKKENLAFPTIKKETVSQLEIKSETQTTRIYRKNPPVGGWYLKKNGVEFLADSDRIETIINNLLSLRKANVVSTNKKKHQQFGIGKQKITVNNHQLFIGNSVGLNKNYLRIDNQSEVFTGENFSEVFTPDDYRDLLVHLVDKKDKINHLEIEFDGNKIILEKKKNDWLANNKKAKKERIDFIINDLKTLKANDILVEDTNLPVMPLVLIKLKEGRQEKTASFYQQDDNNYFLKTSVSDLIYQVPAAYVASLKKEEKDFTE